MGIGILTMGGSLAMECCNSDLSFICDHCNERICSDCNQSDCRKYDESHNYDGYCYYGGSICVFCYINNGCDCIVYIDHDNYDDSFINTTLESAVALEA